MDDEDFTRRLFTPISLEGTAYLSKTTWPISTVLRLYLENLNWVSNAETGSGPTPVQPPDYATFLDSILALQRLQDRKLITLSSEERDELVSGPFDASENTAQNAIDSVQQGLEIKNSGNGVRLIRRKEQPVLRVDDIAADEYDWLVFCDAFKLNPNL